MRRVPYFLAFLLMSAPIPALATPLLSLCGGTLGVPCPVPGYELKDLVVSTPAGLLPFLPADISSSGKFVVGTGGFSFPMILDRTNGNFTSTLLTPGLPSSTASFRLTTINDSSLVGGSFLDANQGFSSRGFVHRQGNFTKVVDVTFGDPSSPTTGLDTQIGGINNLGHLVANYTAQDANDPTLFDFRAAVSFDLGLTWKDILGFDPTGALDFFVEEITENGTVVGSTSDLNTGFVCKDAGKATETCTPVQLNSPSSDPLKLQILTAADLGLIPPALADFLLAGFYDDPQGFLFDGTIFGPMDFPGSHSTVPTGIAADGTVVGLYFLGPPGTVPPRGFIATPRDVTVPAPGSLLLVGAGVGAALLSRRLRRKDLRA